jgi:hypothetical protein
MTKGQNKAKKRRRIRHQEKFQGAVNDRSMMGNVSSRNYGSGKSATYKNWEDKNEIE